MFARARSLAYGEMRLILARIVWNFDLRLDAAHKNWVEDNKCYFLWQKGPLNVYLTPKRVSGSAGKPGPTVNA